MLIVDDNISHNTNNNLNEFKQYILIFSTGVNTLKIFKQIYVADRKAFCTKKVIFVVKNIEHFMYKIKEFRNVELIVKSEDLKSNNNNNNINYSNILNLKNNFTKYLKDTYNIADKKEIKKIKQISFEPDILSSTKTSLVNSKKYFTKNNTAVDVFMEISNTKTQGILAKEITEKIKNSEGALASLLVAGVVKQKGDKVYVNI